MNPVELILGGARSGKSHLAEQRVAELAEQHQLDVVYLATAQALDEEMAQRIQHHQQSRPHIWHTWEEPIHLAKALKQISDQYPSAAILLDCLTLWLTNCLLANETGDVWATQKAQFLQQITSLQQPLVIVSNEVGQGIVPLGELNRRFVDESGWLHQQVAELAERVTLVTAGLPSVLKP